MNLHEYQAKKIFADYGLPVSRGYACASAQEAVEAAAKIGGDKWVVKAQVHAGGRGKAGGVKLVSSKAEIEDFAQQWLGKRLVTYQTDKDGQPVYKILVEECTDIANELYLGAVASFITPNSLHGFHGRWCGNREGGSRDTGENSACNN